jgi:hypothetical protein
MARIKRVQEKVEARNLKTKSKLSVISSAIKDTNPGIIVTFVKLDVA